MRALTLILFGLGIAGAASPVWKTSAGVEIHWDNNIADNYTHVSETWGVPFASLQVRQPFQKTLEWSAQADFQYENEFAARSPTLNSPFDLYTLRLRIDFSKDLLLSLFGKGARSFDEDWRLVKILGRAGTDISWSPSRWKFEFSFQNDWENYGDHAQDGNTRWYLLDVRYALLRNVQVGWGYGIEDRQAFSSSYTYFDQKVDAKLRYLFPKGSSLNLACARSYKIYSTSKRNQEWQGALSLSIPIGNLKFKSDLAGKETLSNREGYSWSETSSTTSLEWSMDNKKAPKRKTRSMKN